MRSELSHLSAEGEFEEEAQETLGNAGSQGVLQVDFVSLEHEVHVLRAPAVDDPDQVILDHRNHRVGNASLLRRQTGVEILAELLAQVANYYFAVGYLLAVQLDERQLSLLRTEFHLVVDILKHI